MTSPSIADTPRTVWRAGIDTAFSGAGLALLSSFVALGALMGEAGFSPLQAVLFSLFCFALPGQLVAAELHAHGVGLLAVTVTVWLVNARLFPMTVALLPLLVAPADIADIADAAGDAASPRAPMRHRVRDMLIAHLVAVTSWVCFLASYTRVTPEMRRRYFVVLAGVLWLTAAMATIVGYHVGALLPQQWLVALLFLNPAYFLCLMLASLSKKSTIAAFAGGALLLPVLHQLSPDWDILIAGVIAGSASFIAFERRRG